ncbi:MAG: Ig-like domain-containing protein, partial [Bacteroidales bacterium]|nr:Ig-like domain-containing protein [Bacteroidales bacterium]
VTAATAAEGTITYTVAPNETTEVRNGWIKLTLSKEGKDDIVKEIVVTQQTNTPVQLVEGTVPNMNQKMFGVTFPDEFASLDATTFEGWVNAVNYNGAQANLPTFMGTENAFLVRFENGKPQIVLGDPVTGGGEIKATASSAMSTGEWHHIAAVYTRNAKVVLYVDGKKVAENNTKDYPVTYNSGVKPGTNDDAKIGRKFWVGNAFSTRWFNASMSHLRVWSKALTNDEVVASANNRALETAEGLIANWPLTEDKGLKVTDLSGNGLNAEYKSASDADGVIETTEPERTTGVELPTLDAPVHPTSIKITAEETLVKTGLTIQLSATVLPENAWDKSISWRSENEEVATVDQNGLVKGVTPGTVKIYAENAAENLSDNVTITVEARYTPGTVSPDFSANMNSLVIDWGSTDVSSLNDVTVEWKMKAKAWTNSYQYKSWYWTYTGTSKVNSVFGVDGQWLLRIGDANIPENQLEVAGTGSENRLDYDFQAGSWYHVAVVYSVTSGTTKYYVNGNLKGTVEGVTVPANFTGARISESLKDNGVNSRFFNGYLADLRVWKTARTAEQIFAGLNAFDDNSNEDLLLNLKLDNGNQVFVNSANTDATVQPTQEFEWIEERPEIQELVEATEVKIDTPASTEIKVTETLQLSAQVLPENAENRLITWSSGNTAVATVDQNGLVKGVGLGEVTITATNEKSGLSDSVTLTVVRKYEAGTVTPDFSVNYNSVSINWGTANVSSLGKLTVEWKMNAHDFFNEYYYGSNNARGTSVVNSVFGVEGKWLLRIGDLNLPNNQLELADHNHPRLDYDFKTDTWYHVAVTYDTESGKTEFYVNGELKGSFEGTATSAADLRGAFIGQSYKDNSVNSRYFNGYLADVRVWNTIRSAEQIKSGINEFTDQASENLLLYLKLDEGLAALVNSATASDATASFTADAGWSVLRPVIDVTDGGATGTLPDFDPVTGFQW